MGKNKNKVRLSFCGGSADGVTGSMVYAESSTFKILIECGLQQGGTVLEDYRANNRRLPFKPKELDYIFLGHVHADHSLLIPRLYKMGCRAKIIAPEGTVRLFETMAKDSAYIMGRDAELLTRQRGVMTDPIYEDEDVSSAVSHFVEYDIGEKIRLTDTITFCFQNSGHIINSAQIELWLTEGNHTSKVLYTSDLGNISTKKYYCNKFTPVQNANIAIVECTYGDNVRAIKQKDRDVDLAKIKSIVTEVCCERKHKVLIPIFSLDRAQNLLTHLYDIFGKDESFDIPILIDSPLTVNITKLYGGLLTDEHLEKFQEVMSWENIVLVKDYSDSKSWQANSTPCVVLSASGFMVAGRSRAWAKALLPDAQSHILFVGFSSDSSLAGKIKNGKRQSTINIDKKPVPNRCGITDLKSFSSHMTRADMLKYYSDINADKIYLVHGDMKSKIEFAKDLQAEISRKNKSSKVVVVNKGTEILL